MALKSCKKCKEEVSSNASKCPNCGVLNPGVTGREMLFGVFGLCALVAVGVAACSDSDEDKAAAANSLLAKESACLQDLECIGNKGALSAGLLCQGPIEKLAKNSVKWTDGALEPKFSRFRWKDQKAGIVTHIGDKAQFQNGFGAYVNVTYTCDLDMNKSPAEVVEVTADEGRL